MSSWPTFTLLSLGNLPNAFFESTKARYCFFFLTRCFSIICRAMKMAPVLPYPSITPNLSHRPASEMSSTPLGQAASFHHMVFQFPKLIEPAYNLVLWCSRLALVKGGTHLPGGQPLQRLRGRAVAIGSPVAGSLGWACQSVIADMNCVFSYTCFCIMYHRTLGVYHE